MRNTFVFFAIFFIPVSVSANLICNADTVAYDANYIANTYVCELGEFLPANTLGCKPCPGDYTCSGGVFDFKQDYAQGITLDTNIITSNVNNACALNFPNALSATFSPNVHTCVAGQFLPANVDGCSPCLPDNYCAGGTFTFSETVDQGLSPCPDAHPFAPAGMWTQSQCGRKLHLGDDVLYLHQGPATPTARRLYVRFNDVVYSANATEVAIAPTTMSEYAKRALHVIIDGVEYLIHDDSAR